MDLFAAAARPAPQVIPVSHLDLALTAQILVAWAGEGGEEPRLGWWRTDLISEFGGEDLFQRLLPSTWPWAVLQAAREAAARKDAELRSASHDPDRILSLFNFGFHTHERIEERFQSLKRSAANPQKALPGLALLSDGWQPERFWEWVESLGPAERETSPIGRRLNGPLPAGLDQQVRALVAALAPAASHYPLPHYWRAS